MTYSNPSATNPHSPDFAESQEGEFPLVAQWSRIDPVRWISGVIAGALAGVLAFVMGGILSSVVGRYDFWFPVKLMATPVLGARATEFAATGSTILVGVLVWEAIAIFWGFVYSHFVYSNSPKALFPMGLVWSIYLWVFNWNLYFQSFKSISVTNLPRQAVLAVCLTYGLSLSMVALIDRVFRGKKS